MRLQESGAAALVTGGITNQIGTFKINANAKAFQILSSGLYTHKIKAVIRELSCNAYDAHVAVGAANKPFEIHLPNQFEPFFRVTDFGPGLSEEDIYGLYTTYFSSTKTDSNDYIGALGLGSKSPFCYTQTFTVTSRFDGMKKIYTAFLTDEGMPSIVKMSEEAYDGPTGLDVQMAVKSNDFYTFQTDAVSTFTYFPVTPNFTGAKIRIEKPVYSTKGTGWAIRKDAYGDGGARAIQGVVAYPVPHTNDAQADELLRLGVDMFFQIGELEVSASRESLSMNKATSKNLADRIKMVATEIGAEVSKTIANAPTLWEAVTLFNELMKNNSIRYALKNVDIMWNGQKVPDYIEVKPQEHPTLSLYACEKRGYRHGVKETSNNFVKPQTHILVRNDLTRGSKGVLTRWIKQFGQGGNGTVWYLIGPGFGQKFEAVQEDINEFIATALGGPTTVKLLSEMKAELPKIVRTASGKLKNAFQVFQMDASAWKSAWAEVEEDEDFSGDQYFYVRTFKNQPGIKDGLSCPEDHISEPRNLFSICKLMVQLGHMASDDQIFSGSPRFMTELNKMDPEEREKWVDLTQVALKAVVFTPTELEELKQASPVSFYDTGLKTPRRNLEDTLQSAGITDDNRTIPAIADIEKAYRSHFVSEKILATYKVRLELARIFGKTPISLNSKEVEMPHLSKVMEKFKLVANAFTHYAEWSQLKEAISLIEALFLTEKI